MNLSFGESENICSKLRHRVLIGFQFHPSLSLINFLCQVTSLSLLNDSSFDLFNSSWLAGT